MSLNLYASTFSEFFIPCTLQSTSLWSRVLTHTPPVSMTEYWMQPAIEHINIIYKPSSLYIFLFSHYLSSFRSGCHLDSHVFQDTSAGWLIHQRQTYLPPFLPLSCSVTLSLSHRVNNSAIYSDYSILPTHLSLAFIVINVIWLYFSHCPFTTNIKPYHPSEKKIHNKKHYQNCYWCNVYTGVVLMELVLMETMVDLYWECAEFSWWDVICYQQTKTLQFCNSLMEKHSWFIMVFVTFFSTRQLATKPKFTNPN